METFEDKFELRFANLAPEVWQKLGDIHRTGWVERGVRKSEGDQETVQEHTIALRKLAVDISKSLPEFLESDKQDLLDMLEVHDWPEAIHGDERIVASDPTLKRRLKEEKFRKEKAAMETICGKVELEGERIMNLWLRFEEQGDFVSQFAKQLDIYQAMEKASEYEKAGEPVTAKEFIDYSEKDITHPVLVQRIKMLKGE